MGWSKGYLFEEARRQRKKKIDKEKKNQEKQGGKKDTEKFSNRIVESLF